MILSDPCTFGNPFFLKFQEILIKRQSRISTTEKGIEEVLATDSPENQDIARIPSKLRGIL